MRTLIVADLHLGGAERAGAASRQDVLGRLLEAAREADRVVLLGDVLELRERSPQEALPAARPFFEMLSEACPGREVILVAGNHDHSLLGCWRAQRDVQGSAGTLGLEQRLGVPAAAPLLSVLAEWSLPARLTVSYPGLWVREDVYATHGHYLDCHLSTFTAERLGIAALIRLLGATASSLSAVEQYEAVTAPVYGLLEALARLRANAAPAAERAPDAHATPAERVARLAAPVPRLRPLARPAALGARRLAQRAVRPLLTAALARARVGRPAFGLSGEALLRAELLAMRTVLERLNVPARHVVFGHTHSPGPLPGSDPRSWELDGISLYNCGALADACAHDRGQRGHCVVVESHGPPSVRPL